MLNTIQHDFMHAILSGGKTPHCVGTGQFSAHDLMQIYQHNYVANLSGALSNSYACVLRLVGADFFNQLAREFIKNHPSKTPNLMDYGAEFSAFIAANSACQALPYLADVAQFEWLYERCYFSKEAVFLLHSNYPIVQIWQLDENSPPLDLGAGETYLKIYKIEREVVVETLSKSNYQEELCKS